MCDYQHQSGDFRQYLPDLSQPRFTQMSKQDAHVYAKNFIEGGSPPWIHSLFLHWRRLLSEPFKGITNDGVIKPDLFKLQDEEVPVHEIATAAQAVLADLSPEQSLRTRYHIDSPEWRTWSNPEFLLSDKGVRLDELPETLCNKILALLAATLSPEGYKKAIGAMRINHFLGQLVESPAVMNEHSYNLVFFGDEPSTERPWGFAFYGHHLCLNIFLYKRQIVISPWFVGAEPNYIDAGPYKGTRILNKEEELGLQLMQSLPQSQKDLAQIYKQLRDPAMPRGRWNHDDQRHLCGAYRDNRIVPYEGILVSSMTTEQQEIVQGIFRQYLLFLPSTALQKRLQLVRDWFQETYFCWIGGYSDNDPFYYRLQSPVIIVEFDHHSGVFLTNVEPAKHHIHTLLRTPNGGDYGMALRPLMPPAIDQDFVWEGERPGE